MMPYLQIPYMGKVIISLLLYLVIIAMLYLSIIRKMSGQAMWESIAFAILLIVIVFEAIFIMEIKVSIDINTSLSKIGQWMADLPWILHGLLILTFVFFVIWGLCREKRIKRTEITPGSIREALDNLPSGVCFSNDIGMPILTNRRMYQLAREVGGQPCHNAEVFWGELERFESHNKAELIESGDSPTIRWGDGGIWQFNKTVIIIDNQQYAQTTASDITRLYTLTQELAKSNEALNEYQERQKDLLANIVDIAKEEELLESKVKIHNELGQCLLLARRHLTGKAPTRDISNLFSQWERVMDFMENTIEGAEDKSGDAMRELIEVAEELGCRISFEGCSQEEAGRIPNLKNAIREAMTNAIRHGEANRLEVKLEKGEGQVKILIQDNGLKPINTISEGGGLSLLRRRIERAGGYMEIRYSRGVELHIRIPIREEAI